LGFNGASSEFLVPAVELEEALEYIDAIGPHRDFLPERVKEALKRIWSIPEFPHGGLFEIGNELGPVVYAFVPHWAGDRRLTPEERVALALRIRNILALAKPEGLDPTDILGNILPSFDGAKELHMIRAWWRP